MIDNTDLEKQGLKVDFESLCRQFLYDYSPHLEGEEFDEAMEVLEQLGKVYSESKDDR